MAAIPKPEETTVTRIYKSYEDANTPRFSRRLGASQIGRSCMREIYYSFRWAKTSLFEGRMLRLFQKGYLEETIIAADLKRAGVQFLALDESTGQQFEFNDIHGHMVAKLDGVCCGLVEAPTTWHTCEFKTANQKAFDKIQKEGVQKAQPEHFAQMQIGLHMAELDRCLYLVVNKNTEEIYIERVKLDKKEVKRIRQRAQEIVFGREAPDRIGTGPAHWECKFCNFHGICYSEELAEKNCRTCVYSTPLEGEDGVWSCDNFDCVIDHDKQKVGCDGHKYRPEMCSDAVNACQNVLGARVMVNEENLSV